MTVRWAYIGAGRHAELWIAPAIERAANAVTVGVWSRQLENARAFAGRHDIGRVYQSLDEAVADPEVDAVFISTPNSLHAAHSIAALQAGKHVLVEKPMAVSLDDARAMVAAARSADRQLGIGFHLRHNEVIQDAQRRIAAGEIGDVSYARAQFNLVTSPPPRMEIPHAPWKRDPDQIGGAAALMGMGVHVLDLLRFLVGREVVSVSAFAVGVSSDQPLESFASVLLEFEGGAQGHVAYGGRFPLSQNDAVVYGSQGRIVAENVVDVVTSGTLHVSTPEGRIGARTASRRPEPSEHYQRQIEAFSRAVAEGSPFGASGEDGLRSVEIQTAVIESQRNGGRIAVPRTDR